MHFKIRGQNKAVTNLFKIYYGELFFTFANDKRYIAEKKEEFLPYLLDGLKNNSNVSSACLDRRYGLNASS